MTEASLPAPPTGLQSNFTGEGVAVAQRRRSGSSRCRRKRLIREFPTGVLADFEGWAPGGHCWQTPHGCKKDETPRTSKKSLPLTVASL